MLFQTLVFAMASLLLVSGCQSYNNGGEVDSAHVARASASTLEEGFKHHRQAATIDESGKLLCVDISPDDPQHFCTGMDEDEPYWFLIDSSGSRAAMGSESFGLVESFELDRHGKYIALETSEEGHPMFGVYDFQLWLKQNKQPEPIYFLNPYPGTLHVKGWENNEDLRALPGKLQALRFSTDGPLKNLNDENRNRYPLEAERTYRLNLSHKRVYQVNEK
ncbi:hypothetical protein D8Y20_03770 [Mariprofundus sp. EBB-1]|uniref:hypothetical protein n=1 Tax=Mariprofundus sp. EBB-1 TaxID=2650971 RepID=UPI000EF18512|nr:hypothetical protein [Mariprofundus sp. EBB-1]RLL54027.1 hypothetical protein D8Y20_03770 [Mariprofundus sp. EBB-1]